MTSATEPRLAQAVADVSWLFPGASVAVADSASGVDYAFEIVPNSRGARLLAPAGSRAAAATSVLRFSSSTSPRERVGKAIFAAGVRVGAPRPSRRYFVTVRGPQQDTVRDVLADLLGEPVQLAMGVGALRANSKPVLQVLSESGRTIAFAKVARTDVSRALVQHEARALNELKEADLRALEVPQVIDLLEWNGGAVLVLSALPTPAIARRRASSLPIKAMRQVAELGGATHKALSAGAALGAAAGAVGEPGVEALENRLRECVAALLAGHGDVTARHGRWHGDWGPWNMSWAGNHLRVWDWERFGDDVPVGMDAMHYRLQPLLHRSDPPAAVGELLRESSGTMRDMALEQPAPRIMLSCYLSLIVSRYLHDIGTEHGSVLTVITGRLLSLLEELLGVDDAHAPTELSRPRGERQ